MRKTKYRQLPPISIAQKRQLSSLTGEGKFCISPEGHILNHKHQAQKTAFHKTDFESLFRSSPTAYSSHAAGRGVRGSTFIEVCSQVVRMNANSHFRGHVYDCLFVANVNIVWKHSRSGTEDLRAGGRVSMFTQMDTVGVISTAHSKQNECKPAPSTSHIADIPKMSYFRVYLD